MDEKTHASPYDVIDQLVLELREDIEYLQRRLEQMTKHRDEWRQVAYDMGEPETVSYTPPDDRLDWEGE